MATLLRLSNFGKGKASLSTVGYTLRKTDDTVYQARTTTGVFEVGTATGIYGAEITFPNDIALVILWDTGEATPLYAASVYSPAEVASLNVSGGGLVIGSREGNVWTPKQRDEVLERLRNIEKKVKNIPVIIEAIEALRAAINGIPAELQPKILKPLEETISLLKEIAEWQGPIQKTGEKLDSNAESVAELRRLIEMAIANTATIRSTVAKIEGQIPTEITKQSEVLKQGIDESIRLLLASASPDVLKSLLTEEAHS